MFQGKLMSLISFTTAVAFILLAGSLFPVTYNILNGDEGSLYKCTQLQKKLSAQLQAVNENKSLLEEELENEKINLANIKEEFQAYKSTADASSDKEKQKLNRKYKSLEQKYEILLNSYSDLQSGINRLKQQNMNILEEKQNLLTQANLELAKVREEKGAEIISLKEQLSQANNDIVELQMSHDNAVARSKNTESNVNQLEKQSLNEINEQIQENDVRGQLHKWQIGDEPSNRLQKDKYLSQGNIQHGYEFNTKAPDNHFYLVQRQFPQKNSKELH